MKLGSPERTDELLDEAEAALRAFDAVPKWRRLRRRRRWREWMACVAELQDNERARLKLDLR